jgi:hypothetical protein
MALNTDTEGCPRFTAAWKDVYFWKNTAILSNSNTSRGCDIYFYDA